MFLSSMYKETENTFEEIAEVNEWTPCGKAADMPTTFAALQTRFGLSPREIRSKLSILKRGLTVPLYKHAAEVE